MAKNVSQNRERISDKVIFDMPVSVDAEFSSALRTVLVEASTASWEFWFGFLEQFKGFEDHCRVPRDYKLGGFKLGQWVAAQRSKKDWMSPERRQKLTDIGFAWDALTETWEEGFTKLLQFKELKGHCRVPMDFKLDGYNLGTWVSNQRTDKDSISSELKQRLDDIGFIWDALTEAWEKGFTKLLKFKETKGHCNVPKRFKLDGYNLGQWVSTQRKNQGIMSPEREQRLDDIGFIWDNSKDKT